MWGKLIEIWLPGERRQPWRPQSVRIAQLICNLLELRLTRIKLEGLVWQDRLQCRLSKPAIILSIFLSRAAAVKLLLTLQLSLAPRWVHQQMFQSHLQITVETAFWMQCLTTLREVGRMLSSCISWAETTNLLRRTLKWGITVWSNSFKSLFSASVYAPWLALENIHTVTHIQAIYEKCGYVVFPRACHGSVSKSVWTVCQKQVTGRKTWSPV